MNDTLLVLCSPDFYSPSTRKAVVSLKNTQLEGVELIVVDNCHDGDFCHPVVMQSYLEYADAKSVVFMDDDVAVYDPQWLAKFNDCAKKTGAAIVGCTHTYVSGEVNHEGILMYADGSTELLREKVSQSVWVPAVSSAFVFIPDASAVRFDREFKKYHHDVDICISAWRSGGKVALTSNLSVVHKLGGVMAKRPDFTRVYADDSERISQKWREFASRCLYEINELKDYAAFSNCFNWERYYNEASGLKACDPKRAVEMFCRIASDCPFNWRKAGAWFHLYLLESNKSHLENCLKLNPHHLKAKELLAPALECCSDNGRQK